MIQFFLIKHLLRWLIWGRGWEMEVITPVNVVIIIEVRCIGGLKEALRNEGSDKWLHVDFV